MEEPITVVYEGGILRPLKPYHLPESSRLQIQIIGPAPVPGEGKQVRQALAAAGLIRTDVHTPALPAVSETELIEAGEALGQAGSLAEFILAERTGR